MIFQEEEGAEVAAGADWFVVNGFQVEADGGEGVATELVTNDVVEGDITTDVGVGLEGEGAVVVVGDQARGGGDAKDFNGIVVSIGVTGE